ncbi:MAG TPA: hypothetical protein PLZ58_01790, partial [Candidatus Saccharibacteria bacterium]|nr:hypothetical protein [Candidatus Saccharibacteria bacterium]
MQKTSKNRNKSGLLGWLLVALVVLALTIGGVFSLFGPPSNGGSEAQASDQCTNGSIHYFALDGGKEVKYAFGPRIEQTEQDEILTNLHDRRCVDPALTSAHFASWGFISYSEMDATTAKFAQDHKAWRAAIAKMEKKEAESAIGIEAVAKGLPSLYMVPTTDGKSVTIHQGFTSSAGTALVFTHPDGTKVTLRLECGFQPVIPPCSETQCAPPCPDNSCAPPCPPETPHGTWPVCKDSPNRDPGVQGHNKPGGNGVAPAQKDPEGPPAAGEPPATYT